MAESTDTRAQKSPIEMDPDASPVAVSDAATGADKEIEVMEIEDDEVELDEAELTASQLAEPREEECSQCKEKKECQYNVKTTTKPVSDTPASEDVETIEEDVFLFICNRDCYRKYKGLPDKSNKSSPVKPRLSVARPPMEMPMEVETPTVPFDPVEASKRRCSQCKQECGGTEANLSWETMDFCNEECLGQYQKELGSFCANCRGAVMSSSMGKYCVRFGFNVRQFCSSSCLEEFKKGLKVCSYCQRDITGDVEGFLAPIGDKGQFKDFCSQDCMAEYEAMSGTKPKPQLKASCAVCCNEKEVAAEVVYSSRNGGDLPRLSTPTHKLCSNPCLAAFKFANNLHTELCEMCKRNFDLSSPEHKSVYMNEELHHFCSKTCLNVKTISNRKIVACNWCKVKKYNFDMIRKIVGSPTAAAPSQAVMLCSLNCLALYQVSVTATSSKLMTCDHCGTRAQGMYHLTMSDATLRNFCSYQCCMNFQTKFTSPILTTSNTQLPRPTGTPTLVSSQSLASPSTAIQAGGQMPVITNVTSLAPEPAAPPPPPQIKVVQQVFVKPKAGKTMSNRTTQCRPNTTTKGVSCRPICSSKGTQTDEQEPEKVVIPIPVPIYVPAPMHMFSAPFPVPVPFPLPIAVPIFIPTTRNTAKGISKEIKPPPPPQIKVVQQVFVKPKAGKTMSNRTTQCRPNTTTKGVSCRPICSSKGTQTDQEVEYTDTTPSFGEDMLQMALKMATELTEPAAPSMDLETALPAMSAPPPQLQPQHQAKPEPRPVRKRARTRGSSDWAPPGMQQTVKRTRTNSQEAVANQAGQQASRASNGSPPPEPQDPAIEADPNLSLKYTYGVLAFRKWIRQKNAELVAKSGRHAKTFKTDILQLSTDELNFALCMFVKEVRKPDGEEYAPDIIYYLCLAPLMTRVEEEHLWESQQLGAHSPHVLLFTLMYFNTKHFLLTEAEDHMRLSFTHVMKHWKRNHAQPGKTGSTRNVLLRYYPPQSVLDADERKKKVYEQQENESDPLRCPVKLYEFYVSKWSCVPDSPVWYSTMALPREAVSKMLNRIRMVREVLSLLQSLNY
ncbi:hypothetical protein B566_EDAN011946 [Ephemera danica]|nr:hypothetical protein B566_EDAN011946 [Ephemera danica]